MDGPFQLDARCRQEDTLMSSVNVTVAKRPAAGLSLDAATPDRRCDRHIRSENTGNGVSAHPLLLSDNYRTTRSFDPVMHENRIDNRSHMARGFAADCFPGRGIVGWLVACSGVLHSCGSIGRR